MKPLISPIQFILAHEQSGPDRLQSLREAIHGTGSRCQVEDCVPFVDLPFRLSQHPPDVVLVDTHRSLLEQYSPAITLAAKLGIPVLLVGPHPEADTLIKAVRLGARDYLDEAEITSALHQALETLLKQSELGFQHGKILTVLSAHPGVGVTTIATNLAFQFAKTAPRSIALVELANAVPEMALLLDQKPLQTLASLLARIDIADTSMLRQTMVPHPEGVDLLVQPPDRRSVSIASTSATRRLLTLLRATYRQSVIDLGDAREACSPEVIKSSDRILIVVRPDVVSVHLTRLLIHELNEQGVPAERIQLAVNQSGGGGELDANTLNQTFGIKISAFIPPEFKLLNLARNRGVPFTTLGAGSRLFREMNRLASQLGAPIYSLSLR